VGQEPDRIRAEIEQTRAEMTETVDALGYKADVKTRTKENLQDKKESAKESIVGVKDRIVGGTPDSGEVKDKARQAKSVAEQNPIGLAIGSVAVGFVAGMLIPATRVEDEKLGDVSDSVIDKVKETGQEALEHGKQVAQEAAQSAQETVKESGQEHAQRVKESAQQSAQDVRQDAQDQTSSSGSPATSTYQTR
jgi:gas vesicle protein